MDVSLAPRQQGQPGRQLTFSDPFGLRADTVHVVGSDEFKQGIQQEYNGNAAFRATYDAHHNSTKNFFLVEGASVAGGCEGVYGTVDVNYCAAPGFAFGPRSDRAVKSVNPAMEQSVGRPVTGGLLLINHPAPYAGTMARQAWHEMTHTLGYVDGTGAMHLGHTQPIWCGVPGSQASCPR